MPQRIYIIRPPLSRPHQDVSSNNHMPKADLRPDPTAEGIPLASLSNIIRDQAADQLVSFNSTRVGSVPVALRSSARCGRNWIRTWA